MDYFKSSGYQFSESVPFSAVETQLSIFIHTYMPTFLITSMKQMFSHQTLFLKQEGDSVRTVI